MSENKSGWQKFWQSWVGIILTALLLMYIGSGILGLPIEIMNDQKILTGDAIWESVNGYIPFLGIWILTIIFYLKSKNNRWLLPKLGTAEKGNNVLMLLGGLVAGLVANGGSGLIAMANGDFTLAPAQVSIPVLLMIFVCVFIQSSAEELLNRNFLYQRMLKKSGKAWIAILGNAVFFAALHGTNPGLTVIAVVNLLLCGILLSLIVWATGSFWFVCGFHAMWNFTQNFLLGLPNSGNTVPYSVYTMVGEPKDSFAYSASFGIEGGLLSTLVYAAACVLVYFIGRKRNAKA